MPLFLSRKDYDRLYDNNRALLEQLFRHFSCKWSLAGVEFYGVPSGLVSKVQESLA